MKRIKTLLASTCLLALLAVVATTAFSPVTQPSAAVATVKKDCMVCISCDEDEYGHAMYCCMGFEGCGTTLGMLNCDGELYTCSGYVDSAD